MKFFHNDKVSLGWAIFVELVAHGFFAFQAFLLGGFLGEIALESIFGARVGQLIGAWALAIFIFGAAFQAFVLGEYMREHVESFENTEKGNGSYIRSWKQIRWLVAALEISSLAFRVIVVTQAGDYRQAAIVAAFGAILLFYAFAQAKVIHASVNRPVEYEVMRARDYAGRSLVGDSMKYVPKMSNSQKTRFLHGDTSAIDEVEQSETDKHNEKLQPKVERNNKEKQRQEHIKREHSIAERFKRKMLGGDEQPASEYERFTDALSSPGHHQSNGSH